MATALMIAMTCACLLNNETEENLLTRDGQAIKEISKSQDMTKACIGFYRKMTCSIPTCIMGAYDRYCAWPVECDNWDVLTMWLAAHAPLVNQEYPFQPLRLS